MNRILLVVLTLFSLTAHSQGTQTVKIRSCAICPVNYEATTVRNLATYPLGTTGRLAFHAAVTAGTFNLNVPNGAVIPAGTKPPKLVPSPPVVNWMTVVRYSYNTAKRLDVEAAGQPVTAKFERIDGQAFVGQSSGGQPLNSGVAYGPGSLSGPSVVNQEWSFLPNATVGTGVPAVPIRITFTHVATGATVWYLVTPVLGATKLLLAGTLPPAPVACNLILTANTQTVACGGSATLTATASGTSASGLTYAWSGNGTSGNTASINVTAPSSNGTFSYTVVASKPGCSPVSAVAQVTVTGCTTTPSGIDNFSYVSYPATDPEADNGFPVFETDRIKVVLATRNQTNATTAYAKMGLGGAIYNVYDKNDAGFNWLVNPRYNRDQANGAAPYVEDYLIGPQNGMGMCLYQHPIPSDISQYGFPIDRVNDSGLGYNPNEGGDDARFSGVRLHYGRQANKWNVRTRPRNYEAKDIESTPITYEKWAEVDGIAIKQHYKITSNRTDVTGFHKKQETLRPEAQEMPCYYANGADGHTKIVWYDGNNPYVGENPKEWTYNSSQANAMRRQALYVTEPLIAVCNADKTRCTGLLLHNNMRAQVGKFGDGGNRDWISTSQGSIYIGDNPYQILDDQITMYKYSETLIGSWAEMRQYVYSHTYRPQAKPEFRFNSADRKGWHWNKGRAEVNHPERHTWDDGIASIQANGGWIVRFGTSSNSKIYSPAVAYKATDIQTIYVNMSYSGSSSEWELSWKRNRQIREGSLSGAEELYQFDDAPQGGSTTMDNADQKVRCTVQGNGSTQTYAFQVSTKAGWRNIINELHLTPHPNAGQSYSSGGWAKINWISTNTNGPAQNDLSAWWSIALLMSLAGGTAVRRRSASRSIRSRTPPLAVRSQTPSLSTHRQTIHFYGRS